MWKWLWRHSYIDIGYTGVASGKLGPIVDVGIIIAPTSSYIYWGFGLGGGAGVSATVNIGTSPSQGTALTVNVRGGTGAWGGRGTIGSTVETPKPTGSIGGGWGIGAGGVFL